MVDAWQTLRSELPTAVDDERRTATLRVYAETCDPRDGHASYSYETRATDIATTWPATVPLCDRIARTGEGESERFRFLCLSVAFNGYRREHHFNQARSVLDAVAAVYGAIPLFGHYRAMSMADLGPDGLRKGLEWAEQAHRDLPDNAGVTHTCAVYIAELGDVGALGQSPADRDELARGVAFADEAIRAFPEHARFYHTRARLRRLAQDYDGSRVDLARAIDMEPRDGAVDSRERVARYLIERSLVDSDQAVRRMIDQAQGATAALAAQTRDLKRSLAASQIQVVEVIGFVTAVVGLVLISADALSGRSVGEAILLLAALAVMLFGAVGFGSWILRRSLE